MALDIKFLGPQDAGVLANIAPDVFDDPIDAGRADEFLAGPRHHLAVAVDDGQVVGFVSAVPRSGRHSAGRPASRAAGPRTARG